MREVTSSLMVATNLYHKGFSLVPIPQGQKRPSIPWKRYQGERANKDEWTAWFGNEDPPSVGVITGEVSGIVVVDTDSAEAEAWAVANLPETPMRTRTPGRIHADGTRYSGTHRYYAHPGVPVSNKARIRTGDEQISLDIRGDGGLVLAPGAAHPDGGRYMVEGNWKVSLSDLPVFDISWVEREAWEPECRMVDNRAVFVLNGRGSPLNRATHWMAKVPGAVSGHGGDTKTFKVACVLVRGFSLSDDDAMGLLRSWNALCDPPWTEDEFRYKLHYAHASGRESYGGKLMERNSGHDSGQPHENGNPPAAKRRSVPEKSPLERMFLDKIPEVALRERGVATYLSMVSPCTEAADTYHLAALLTVWGSILGRSISVWQGKPVYPNLYTVLVGSTGASRKSTAAHLGLNLLTDADSGVQIVRSLATAEGFIETLATAEMSDSDRSAFTDKGMQPLPRPLHRRTILYQDEMATLLMKARRESSGALTPTIVEAYDCNPTMEHRTRKHSTVAERPAFSLLGCSTEEWLQRYSSTSDIIGGFSNRFVYFDGESKPPMPRTRRPDIEAWGNAVDWIRDGAASYAENPRELPFSPEAGRRWDELYVDLANASREEKTIRGALVQRLPTNILKVALIYAAMQGAESILLECLEAGIGIGFYSARCMVESLEGVAESEAAVVEGKILKAVTRFGRQTARELQQRIYGATAHLVLNSIDAMCKVGTLQAYVKGRTYEYDLAEM